MNNASSKSYRQVTIGDRIVGDFQESLIVAELSANHCHDLKIALKTIEAMKKSGADAVKIQTLTPDTMTIDCDNEFFQIHSNTPWDGKTLYELYSETPLPWDWHGILRERALDLGMLFFSTPYDNSAVDFLENLQVPCYKIASFEMNDIPLIQYVATKGKPVIISTGLGTLSDINEAVQACRKQGNDEIILLKCTSAYPAPIDEANLMTLPNMAETFQTVVGLSDHTIGHSAASASIVLGAKLIEKHFILDRNLGGPDASFSMEPDEFKLMVKNIREVEKSLGIVTYELSKSSMVNLKFSRSLFAIDNIQKGDTFSFHNVKSIRPGFGLHPKHLLDIVGKIAKRDIKKGEPLEWSMID